MIDLFGKRRYNLIDMASVSFVTLAIADGYWLAALLIASLFSVASMFLEAFATPDA